MKKALIVQGGWDGHEPKQVADRFAGLLKKHGYEVTISDTLDVMADAEYLKSLDLFVPCWTMGQIKEEYVQNLSEAVAAGTGMAGCHGGMCDSFRESVLWQFITGGQWVAHPGCDGVNYTVNVRPGSSPIMEGLEDFPVCSEQYYVHVDPAIQVLATTRFPVYPDCHMANGQVDVPVVWTKFWGNGRVFYSSLGHHDDVFEKSPSAEIIMERGLIWAGEGKEYAQTHGLTTDRFKK